jgi:hypothetical protein
MDAHFTVIKKSRGRPQTTGVGKMIGLRLHADQLAEIDEWIARQEDRPSRPEAIRRLLRLACEVS